LSSFVHGMAHSFNLGQHSDKHWRWRLALNITVRAAGSAYLDFGQSSDWGETVIKQEHTFSCIGAGIDATIFMCLYIDNSLIQNSQAEKSMWPPRKPWCKIKGGSQEMVIMVGWW